jgi:hypothetical protein
MKVRKIKAVRKISSYDRKEFHLMMNRPRNFLIPVIGGFHFMTEPTLKESHIARQGRDSERHLTEREAE